MDFVLTLVVGFVAAGLAPLAGFLASAAVNEGKKRRALKRLRNDPLVHVGAHITRLHTDGVDVPLMENCRITSLEKGCITIANGSEVVNFTCQEFEKLSPVFPVAK